jgi:hypothetical protein
MGKKGKEDKGSYIRSTERGWTDSGCNKNMHHRRSQLGGMRLPPSNIAQMKRPGMLTPNNMVLECLVW